MTIQEVFRFSFQQVRERVQRGDSPDRAVIEVVTEILSKHLLTLTPTQYKSWCQKLLSVANQYVHREEQRELIVSIPPASLVIGRNTETDEMVYITGKDRGAGAYHLGNAGTGKSTSIVGNALTDAENGNSVFLFDPHGSAIDDFIRRVDNRRVKDIILIQPDTMTHALGINLLARTTAPIDQDASRLMDFLDRRWGYTSKNPSWGPNMQNLLQASIYTFLYNPGVTLAELPYLYEKSPWFREKMLENVPQTQECFFIHRYWKEEFNLLPSEKKAEWSSPIRNKLNQLLMVRATYLMFAQSHTTLDFSDCMNTGKIVLINLANIGTSGADFVGTLLFEELVKAIYKRDPNGSSPYCSVYIDEFQNFASSLFVKSLAETRKYNVWFYLANQFFKQLPPDLQGAVKQLPHQITQRVDEADAQIRAALYARPPEPTYRQQEIERPVIDPLTHVLSSTRSLTDNRVLQLFKVWSGCFKLSRETAGNPGGEYRGARESHDKQKTHYSQILSPINPHHNEVLDAREIVERADRYFYEVSTKTQLLPFPLDFLLLIIGQRRLALQHYLSPLLTYDPEKPDMNVQTTYPQLFTAANESALLKAFADYEKIFRDLFTQTLLGTIKTELVNKKKDGTRNSRCLYMIISKKFSDGSTQYRGSEGYERDLQNTYEEKIRMYLMSLRIQ